MKNPNLVLLLTLTTGCCVCQGYGQGSLAPLYVFTNGFGSITPLQYGQLLEVGQSYEMTALPDSGFVFSSWQMANVFVDTEITMSASGSLVTNTFVTPSLLPSFTDTSTLTFTVAAIQVIFSDPGVRTISLNTGWQANFAAVPEPSSFGLTVFGLAGGSVLGIRRFRKTTKLLDQSEGEARRPV
jgi:hypothetical protein